MQARDVKTKADAIKLVEERGLSHVKVGVVDMDGILRGKYLIKDKFVSALDHGFGFCDVVLGWDSNDQLYDNVKFTGWHTAYPDAMVRILPHTCRELPFEDTLFFLCEFDGNAEAICPRAQLQKVLKKADAMGFDALAALEYEFFVFDETPQSIREKGYRNLQPWTPGFFGYSVLRSSVNAEFYHELMDVFQQMDIPIEGLHTETGPGVLEAALQVDSAERAGDKAALFKTFCKVLAQRNGLMATFMAKWSNQYPGQSGHIHVSLRDKKTGKSAFYETGAEHNQSRLARQFLAGVQQLLPEWLSLYAQTVNSYSRLIPGFWAPTDATWGIENRTTALRVIPGSDKSQRLEVRIGSADANPYIALAAALGAGLYGIEQAWEPEPIVKGNAYAMQFPESLQLPRTLWESAQRLKASTAARKTFGDAFVEHFGAVKEWEEREFRRHITDWELARYFEII